MSKIKLENQELINKMKNSDTHLPDGEISPKNVKVRITTSVDLDVIEELKRQAANEGEKYQTLLNSYLRASVLKEVKESSLRMLAIANQK